LASPGQNYNANFLTHRKISEVNQYYVASLAGSQGYTLMPVGNQTLILTRKYLPNWAIVVAIVGALFFLVGLLILLYRKTEVATIQFRETDDGFTEIVINGIVSDEVSTRLSLISSNLNI
jgi:hypothetical protein